jgi:hypothetical protein
MYTKLVADSYFCDNESITFQGMIMSDSFVVHTKTLKLVGPGRYVGNYQ